MRQTDENLPSVCQLLAEVRSLREHGDLHRAEEMCAQVVRQDSDNAEGWFALGSVQRDQGRAAESVGSFQQALRIHPHCAEYHIGVGAALLLLGRRQDAADHYGEAVVIEPNNGAALAELGLLLCEQGELSSGIETLRRAAFVGPVTARLQNNLGVALAQAGKPIEADAVLRKALRLEPGYAEAHYNLGNVLRDQGKQDEALMSFREALRLKPDYAEAANNLGLTLNESRRSEEAVAILRHAARLKPALAEAQNNLGLALSDLGRYAEAEAAFEEALRLNPVYAEAHVNLASRWQQQGRLEEALAGYDIAAVLRPNSPSTCWNRALALLQSGDFKRGWAEYEWRWKRPQTPPRPFDQSRWDGGPLEGRTILIWMEQGLGDMIQFIRYVPLVKAKGGTVVIECPRFLVPLFSTCAGADQVVAEGDALPPFDVQAPLMSLPLLCGTTLETIPAGVPYLHVDTVRVERWRGELASTTGFRVGVVWQGNPHHQWDRHRSFPLAELEPLAALQDITLVSLQRGPGTEQIRRLNGRFGIRQLRESLDPFDEGFLDLAAIMLNLNLVVTADTAPAHLAGALGLPVWLALSKACDWRWLRNRDDSAWYPTARLFRQNHLGDWRGVFARMALALERLKVSRDREHRA